MSERYGSNVLEWRWPPPVSKSTKNVKKLGEQYITIERWSAPWGAWRPTCGHEGTGRGREFDETRSTLGWGTISGWLVTVCERLWLSERLAWSRVINVRCSLVRVAALGGVFGCIANQRENHKMCSFAVGVWFGLLLCPPGCAGAAERVTSGLDTYWDCLCAFWIVCTLGVCSDLGCAAYCITFVESNTYDQPESLK